MAGQRSSEAGAATIAIRMRYRGEERTIAPKEPMKVNGAVREGPHVASGPVRRARRPSPSGCGTGARSERLNCRLLRT